MVSILDGIYQSIYKEMSSQFISVQKSLLKALNTINTSLTTDTPILQEAAESLTATTNNINQINQTLRQLNNSMIIW